MKTRLKDGSASWLMSKYLIASHYNAVSNGLLHRGLVEDMRKALNAYDMALMERKYAHYLKEDPDGEDFAFWMSEKMAMHYWNSIFCKNDTRKKR